MSIVEFLSQPLWQRLGLTLVHFLWQGLAVAVLVGAFVRVFRLNHGNTRYAAYLLAFVAMIACPVVTFTAIDISISPNAELVTGAESTEVVDSVSYTALPAGDILPEAETISPVVPGATAATYSIPLRERISDWLHISMPWILVIWMVGVVVLSVRLLMGFIGVYRWRHHLKPLPERLAQRIASLSEGLGMRGFSRVFISPTVLQAMAVGYLRPMVLLPAAMVMQMQPEMLEAVIAHELAHIRRLDLWINLAQRVTETLLFYHPAVWWLSNCLRSERELCCDELAVKATGERITYATTLENVGRARFVAKPPILAAGLGQDNKPTLGRVRHILGLTPAQRNCPFWLAGVITVLFLAALVIPTTLALTNQSDEKLMHFESVVVEGIRANRDKFECGYLAWSNTRINEAVVDRVDKELTGQYELWWDGKKIATKYVRDQLYKGPEGNFWVEKQQGGDSYDGGVLSRKPNFRSDNWLGPHITRWRGVGSQDWLIRQDSKQENISRSWSVVDSDGAKLIRVISRNMNETSRDYRAYGIRDYDPSKGYGQVYEEWFNPDDSTRMKNTVKLMEVIPGGWFPVEVNFKSASMEDGVRVDHNNNYKLDVERCSFNDKSALPARVFKGAVDKQLKYQEKLQKYLAMELEGISDVKEIDKADKVKLGAREAIEKFVAAAMAGDFETGRQFADPEKAPYDQIEELHEVAKGQNLWIMVVVADDFDAIAVSSVIQGDHERIGPLVFFLDRKPQDGRDNWWLHDIDMETPDIAEVELKQFLEKHPKAQKVPYEKKTAVQVEAEGAWGEAVEGVQMRVRLDRQRWYEGETPKFRVDMRNKGTVEWKLGLAQSSWEVELDGLWYRIGVLASGWFQRLLLGPGQEHKDIEFYPGVWSDWNINGKPLKFTPGLHTVRLSFVPSTGDRANLRRLRAVSNAVVIEVLPAEADKRDWGEAVAGLQCGLRADKLLWKADETPKLQAVARNVGRDPWRLPEFFFLKVAGKIWRWKGPGPGEPVELKPGEDLDKTTILLSSEDWVPPYESDLRLKLSPGKHIVQLVIIVSVPVPPEVGPVVTIPVSKQLRIESNVVVIEVLPTGERPGTVDDEGDAATTLQAELYEVWRQRDQNLAGAEAFGKMLLEKYTEREEKALICYQLAEIYAQSGQISPSKTIEYARAAWWNLNDPVKKARLFVYWGDALQLSKKRREAARIYLRGLEFCLQFGLPEEKPELPPVGTFRVDRPAEEVEKYRKENKRQMAARRHAKLIGELIEHRQALTGQIVRLYAQLPDAFDELHERVMKYLASEQAAQQLIAAARAYRRNQKVAIPVIMRMGPDPKPDADLLWGQAAEGIRVRLRAEKEKWAAGETPKLKVDVRNDGSHRLLLTSAPDYWGVEVDGVWYRVTIPMLGGAKGMSFGPDKRWYNLELSLDMALGSQNENGGLELAPGRHTVRAALSRGLSQEGRTISLRVVSNPVEIEILPEKNPRSRLRAKKAGERLLMVCGLGYQ